MKIVKVNTPQKNAYDIIHKSMENTKEVSLCAVLDACGCTGNGTC